MIPFLWYDYGGVTSGWLSWLPEGSLGAALIMGIAFCGKELWDFLIGFFRAK